MLVSPSNQSHGGRSDLRDNSEVDIEVEVQSSNGNIRSQTAIFPLMAKRKRL
jgi:hypothetical protein